ncbi:glycosyltransferase family 2 protein [Candidatus Pacearchaeota archaeon]|nr:glycosyltransferase family 2 protein [Candidatus Pacearchaeota archaeon]
MEILSIIYLGFMFLSIYFLFLFLLLFIWNKKRLWDFPKTKKEYSISVLVPAFNEESTIKGTIEAVFDIEYPIRELIVLNDGSTDDTQKIVESLLKKYPKLKLVNKKNSGKGDSLNQGVEMAKGELVVVVDADSYPAKDSFKKLVGFFDDEKVGAATCVFVPRNRNKFFEKLQVIEYNVIAFTRKLLGYVDGIYVTPGPLAMYRKSLLKEIGGFDTTNMTEDIEIAWHLIHAGYKVRMCLSTNATTIVPDKVKPWYKQRIRWTVGGLQCISKYKKSFLRKGMLGLFILPFFVIQLFLGLLGLSLFVYLITTRILGDYIFAKYSIQIGTPLITMNDLYITPSFLNYLGLILFILGFTFTILVLSIMKEKILKKQNIFNLLFYSFVYLIMYAPILITAIYKFIKRNYQWR